MPDEIGVPKQRRKFGATISGRSRVLSIAFITTGPAGVSQFGPGTLSYPLGSKKGRLGPYQPDVTFALRLRRSKSEAVS